MFRSRRKSAPSAPPAKPWAVTTSGPNSDSFESFATRDLAAAHARRLDDDRRNGRLDVDTIDLCRQDDGPAGWVVDTNYYSRPGPR